MTQLTIDDVFGELQKLDEQTALQDNDLTVERVCDRFHWGPRRALRHLEALVAKGVLVLLPAGAKSGPGSRRIWRIKGA